MNKPNIFYEDNKVGKKRMAILATIMLVCGIGGALAIILCFTIPIPEEFPQNIFKDNLAENIFSIIFCAALISLSVYLFVFRAKSLIFKQIIAITEDEFHFAVSINGKNIIDRKDFCSYEIVEKINTFAKVKLTFAGNEETIIKTRKYDELKVALDYLLKDKKNIKK